MQSMSIADLLKELIQEKEALIRENEKLRQQIKDIQRLTEKEKDQPHSPK